MAADIKCLLTADGTPHNVQLIVEGPDGPVNLTGLGIVETIDVHVDNSGLAVSFKCNFLWQTKIDLEGRAEPPEGLDELARAFGYQPPEAPGGNTAAAWEKYERRLRNIPEHERDALVHGNWSAPIEEQEQREARELEPEDSGGS